MSALDPDFRVVRLLKYIDQQTFPQIVGELVRNHPDLRHVSYSNVFDSENGETRDLPKIVWTLKHRLPGKADIERYKARLRPDSTWRNEDGSWSKLYAQYMNCLWQFDVLSRNASEADEILYRFESALMGAISEFKILGPFELFFEEQLEDVHLPKTKDVHVRSIRFRTFMEQNHVQTVGSIDEIRLRTFTPQDQGWETVVRGATSPERQPQLDILTQTHISNILCVSAEQPTGIARASEPIVYGTASDHRDAAEYVKGVDYDTVYERETGLTGIEWLAPGKKPAAGESYFVRYIYWTAFSTLYIPL
jgi:hypothetical protein